MRNLLVLLSRAPGAGPWSTPYMQMYSMMSTASDPAFNAARAALKRRGHGDDVANEHATQWVQYLVAAGPDQPVTLTDPVTGQDVREYMAATVVLPMADNPPPAVRGMPGRCGANARKGTGYGVCSEPLDRNGACGRAADHVAS